jgi:hypothetical protein
MIEFGFGIFITGQLVNRNDITNEYLGMVY